LSIELKGLVHSIAGFHAWNHAEKIKFFAWFTHAQGIDRVNPADIKKCYQVLHLEEPSSIAPFLVAWTKTKPKTATKDSKGYSLVARIREALDSKYGSRPAFIQIDRLLKELPRKVPDLIERDFLDETILCYRAQAYRAAVVMAWNLAYDHLCRFVLENKLAEFNSQYPVTYPTLHAKKKMKAIKIFDDFAELKESEVIQICRSANIISNDVYKIMNEKLGTRNSYAHPSSLILVPQTAEEMILNLVNNIVLKYN
jgi:hypothetical protein